MIWLVAVYGFVLCFSSGMVGGTVLQKILTDEWFSQQPFCPNSESALCPNYCQRKNWEVTQVEFTDT